MDQPGYSSSCCFRKAGSSREGYGGPSPWSIASLEKAEGQGRHPAQSPCSGLGALLVHPALRGGQSPQSTPKHPLRGWKNTIRSRAGGVHNESGREWQSQPRAHPPTIVPVPSMGQGNS